MPALPRDIMVTNTLSLINFVSELLLLSIQALCS
jgi:hypothetical protein